MKRLASPALLLACLAATGQEQENRRVWIGIRMTLYTKGIKHDDKSYPHAIRVHSVVTGSPAEKAGLQAGDLIVAAEGIDFSGPAETLFNRFREGLLKHKAGDVIRITVFRDGVERRAELAGKPIEEPDAWENPEAVLRNHPPGTRLKLEAERIRGFREIKVTLEWSPESPARTIPPNEQIFPEAPPSLAEEKLAEALLREFNLRSDYRDLRERLSKIASRGDAFRLPRLAYAMREPFSLAALSGKLTDLPERPPALVAHAAAWLNCDGEKPEVPKFMKGASVEDHAREIEALLIQAKKYLDRALENLSVEEQDFLKRNILGLGEAFIEHVMITGDRNRKRLEKVQRIVDAATRIRYGDLFRSAWLLSHLITPDTLDILRADLPSEKEGVFYEHATPLGPIIFSGRGRTWHRKPAAVLIDLGGNDFYTQRERLPFSIVIDLGGDDAYESTFEFSQGFGLLGVSILYDAAGNDSYIAQRWGQGGCAFGVGILWDAAGDDVYRGRDYTQGAAFCGLGLLVDGGGSDRYEAPRYAQGLGMPGGFGALVDRGGGDRYFCKGRDQTAYGDEGLFEGWGQGCGVGFRGLASGGLGLLVDSAGDDVYEGGHFTQGGGYYFGWGALVDRGGDDRYIGSRYAQGFAAHQAIGYFEDSAGNDLYTTRQAVAQCCSWDQTVVVFIDRAGNDTYEGGGFSQCASAHNGIAIFLELAGDDTYRGVRPARAGPNDYHGGTSLSLFVDYGGKDRYEQGPGNDAIEYQKTHGVFADVQADPGTLPRIYRRWLKK